ncbi:MAG: DUF4073 domain-containing protein [Clostridiaceae bacterium]
MISNKTLRKFVSFFLIIVLMISSMETTTFASGSILPGHISTVAGSGTQGYSGDGGAATSAQIATPTGVAVDSSGNIYIADRLNNRIRKVDTSGNISTVAGSATGGYSGDGGAATSAQLYSPYGVAVDSSGNIYIADTLNNRIRKVDATSGNISTVAGGGAEIGDGGPATSAQLYQPHGVAVDSSGNIYIADRLNYCIRKVDTSGNISTVAGIITEPGYSGDGGAATSAKLNNPIGVAVDSSGNIYIADTYNNRIRKVDTSGNISTVAGEGTRSYSGDGGAATSAKLNRPNGVVVDSSGNIYIADTDNNRIRKVDTSGSISTVAGTGTQGYSGDGGAATSAQLKWPFGIALDSIGNILFADNGNHRIREVAAVFSVTYYGNGYTGGSAPTDSTAYGPGDTITVQNNTGGLEKTGYTFGGWNEKADGTGTSYAAGDTFSMPAENVTLYAMWIPDAPNVSADDVNNKIIGADGTMEYSTDGGTTWTDYNPSNEPTFPGNQTVEVRVKEAGINPAGDITTLNFTTNQGGGGTSSGGGYIPPSPPTPPSAPTTVTGEVINEKGESVKGIPAEVTTDTNGTKTVEMKSQDAVLFRQPDGTNSTLSDLTKLDFSAPVVTGTGANSPSVTLNSDGTIQVKNLDNGSETKFDVMMNLGNGQKLVIGKIDIKVSISGDVSLTSTLIDPYGVITDASTGKAISGADVNLYYADTARNKAAGKSPFTKVSLPEIVGFKPNDNKNPQVSDVAGAYGWMVFPDTDYYIVATKDGYDQYISPIISVEKEIVKWDFKMTPSKKYVVSYNGNGNTKGKTPIDSKTYVKGTQVTVLGNTGALEKTGYTFAGWNTAADGKGVDYAVGSKLTIVSSNVTLYAKWTPIIKKYNVTYNGNGSTGGKTPIDSKTYVKGAQVTVLGNIGALVKPGYTFAGWNTAADGKGKDYAVGSKFTIASSNITLYAKWTPIIEKPVSVSYIEHVQDLGWQNWVSDGQEAGTTGRCLRGEALKINLVNAPKGAHIKYQVHVQDKGWMDWVSDGQQAGTTGQCRRLEAIKITLENMPGYSVQYQVHVENKGWMDWVSDGQQAGTTGQCKRLEAIRIRIVKK